MDKKGIFQIIRKEIWSCTVYRFRHDGASWSNYSISISCNSSSYISNTLIDSNPADLIYRSPTINVQMANHSGSIAIQSAAV